jgi:hypothetical protein
MDWLADFQYQTADYFAWWVLSETSCRELVEDVEEEEEESWSWFEYNDANFFPN